MNRRLLALLGAVVIVVVVVVVRQMKPRGSESEEQVSPLVAVRVALIVRATLHEYVESWGTVEPQPATARELPASARVSTPVAGILAEARCSEGGRVERGAVLFRLDTRVADVVVTKARQALQFAETAFERQKTLGAGEATSQRQYQEAEQNVVAARNDLANAEAQRALLDVRAPLSGTIVRVNGRPGDAVDLTTVLAEIIDLNRLVVTAAVRSADIGKIHAGQSVQFTEHDNSIAGDATSAPDPLGTIVFIGAEVDGRTDTVTVRAAVPPGTILRPGQFVNVRIITAEHRGRLAVPVEGIVKEDGAPAIAVVDGEMAVRRPVKTGLRDGQLVEVEGDGLREGMTIVAGGAYGLPKESRITVIDPDDSK